MGSRRFSRKTGVARRVPAAAALVVATMSPAEAHFTMRVAESHRTLLRRDGVGSPCLRTRLDQGTTVPERSCSTCGDDPRCGAAGIPTDLSAGWMGRARRRRDLGDAIGVLHEVLARAGIGARDVAAIGITTSGRPPRMGSRDGRPIAHAIVWQDRRTAPQCDALRRRSRGNDRAQDGARARCVLLAPRSAGCSTTSPVRAIARCAASSLRHGHTWLVWNLTNGEAHVTDSSNASRTRSSIFARRLG